jgi:hypothetical protein
MDEAAANSSSSDNQMPLFQVGAGGELNSRSQVCRTQSSSFAALVADSLKHYWSSLQAPANLYE